MKDRLDKADKKILTLLQQDGRMTNADLARKVGLSPPSMLQRVRKLEKSGLIRGYTARIDARKLGFGIQVLAMVGLSMHQEDPIEHFLSEVENVDEVVECYHVSGDYDFMLKVVARDIEDYERIIRQKLSKISSVGKIHSCFVLGVNKESTALPV